MVEYGDYTPITVRGETQPETPIDRESVERLAYRLSEPQSAIRPTISDSRDGAKTLLALRAALDAAEAEIARMREVLDYIANGAGQYRSDEIGKAAMDVARTAQKENPDG